MKNKKIKFRKITVNVFYFILFVVISFISGIWLSEFFFNNEIKDKTDISLIYDVWEILDEDYLDTREDQSKKITIQDNIYGAVTGLAASYEDPYTVFLPPVKSKDLADEISGEFGGVGIEIENKAGFLTVVSPLPETPAWRAGIKPKDIIVEIDKKDSVNFSASQAAKLIRGEPDTSVVLTIVRKGEADLLEIKIKRSLIKIPITKIYNKDGVFVIKLYSFTQNSPELFFDAIREFAKTGNKKLIIDLRGNPGGHLFAAVYISGLFLPEGTNILTEDYGMDKKTEIKAGKYHKSDKTLNIFSDNIKIGILVDGGSASASEILAGSLRDNNRAILLGATTYGKGTVQKIVKFPNETSLKYTIAKWILPRGSWITSKGITVDINIDITEKEIKQYKKTKSSFNEIDPQLLKAIKVMSKINSQKEIVDILEKTRLEEKDKIKKERDKKIKSILKK